MKIHDELQPGLRRTGSERAGTIHITVSPTVSVAFAVIRIVPDSHADMSKAVLRQKLQKIALGAVEVIIAYAAGLFRQKRGNIHSQNKIIRKIGYGLDKKRA